MTQKIKSDNRGFTLIELLVAVLVAGLVMAAVAVFVSAALKEYGMTSTEAALQMEGQTALGQVSDILMTGTEYPSAKKTVNAGGTDLDVYVFDSGERDSSGTVQRQCQIFVLDRSKMELLANTLSEADVKNYIYSDADSSGSELSTEKTLSSQLLARGDALKAAAADMAGLDTGEDASSEDRDSSYRQKYLLAEHISDFTLKTVKDGSTGKSYDVEAAITAQAGDRSRTVSGAYRMRNSTWNNSPVVTD